MHQPVSVSYPHLATEKHASGHASLLLNVSVFFLMLCEISAFFKIDGNTDRVKRASGCGGSVLPASQATHKSSLF